MERLRHLDFELKIERQGDQYSAKVLRSPAGEASGTFVWPFSEDRLEVLVLRLGRLRASTRRIHSAEEEAARELGGKLFEAVFGREVLACFRSSLAKASSREGAGLRLKLRLQDVPELADVPWEFLFDTSVDRFLAQSNRTPIVRYVELPERIRPLTLRLPLHVLVMISSPADYQRLDIERERYLLQEALVSLSKDGKVQIDFLEKATLPALQRRLRDGTYHVFHFIGHGGFDKRADEGVLVLEDENGRGWQAAAHRIGTLLHDHPSLRLAVLNSCEGARNSRTDPFAGMAVTLVRQGVPAVVGMQFEITDEAAIGFSNEFYTALAAGFPVDAAVAEARKAIYAQPNDVEWGTPVLYMRSADGMLFKLTQKPVAEESLPLAAEPAMPIQQPEATPQTQQSETVTPLQPAQDITPIQRQVSMQLIRVLTGHTAGVVSVVFSPDGAMLASGSTDTTVRLWRVPDGTLLRTLKLPLLLLSGLLELRNFNAVSSVVFSPDGAMLASGSSDDTVRLWRVSDGNLLNTLTGHMAQVRSVVFSPDGAMLVSGSTDKTVRLWRVPDGTLLYTLEPPPPSRLLEKAYDKDVTSVAFSPDGTLLVSGSNDQTIRLWAVLK